MKDDLVVDAEFVDQIWLAVILTPASSGPSSSMPLGIARCLRRATWSLPHHVPSPQILPTRRMSTASSILPDDIYDIIVVGGGIAGLALTTSLRNLHPLLNCLKIVSQDTSKSLKIALIERNSLKPSTLSGAPANRCSSLTPSSVRFLQGQSPLAIVDS